MDLKLSYKNAERILEVEDGKVPYLRYPLLSDTGIVKHGFSTRLGGVSEGCYASMNLSFTRGDREEDVRENFCRIADAIGVRCEDMVFSQQTHTSNVRVVTEADRGMGIGKETVRKMREVYGCDPGDILAAVGPSICQDCYEVSEEVIRQFQEHFSEKDWASLFYKKENGKYQMDLWRANEMIFLESGIKTEHIAVTNICTHCNSEVLYSHRAMGDQRGNLAAFLALNEET